MTGRGRAGPGRLGFLGDDNSIDAAVLLLGLIRVEHHEESGGRAAFCFAPRPEPPRSLMTNEGRSQQFIWDVTKYHTLPHIPHNYRTLIVRYLGVTKYRTILT